MELLHASYTKSKRHLRQALLTLLRDRPFSDISVKDIVEEAELARQTFYLHYKDKDELLEEIVRDLAGGLTDLMKQVYQDSAEEMGRKIAAQNHPIFVEYFRYVRRNAESFSTLLAEESGTDFHKRFSRYMDEYRDEYFHKWKALNPQWRPDDEATKYALYKSAIENFIVTLFEWLLTGMETSEQQMGAHHARMWMSYSLLHDPGEDAYSRTVIDKMREKNGNFGE